MSPGSLTLPERIIAIHGALEEVPHAFGGALALAYHAEPRATRDIDLNVFVDGGLAGSVLGPLAELGVDVGDAATIAARDGQVRVLWDLTPIDLFFAYDEFHTAAEAGAIEVPFATTRIRVLSATHLVVCKVVFDRPRDWVDIEAMVAAGAPIDPAEVLRWVGRTCGDDDRRYDRIAAILVG